MALVNCSECGNPVSTAAASCPKCGAPVGSDKIGTPLSTIQKTSKHLKIQIIISSLLCCIGIIGFFIILLLEDQMRNPFVITSPILILFTGLVWYIIIKVRIWWHHG